MANKFTLSIDLGNDAMNTPQDVAAVLQAIAKRLSRNDATEECDSGRCCDMYGNSVGNWSYENEVTENV